MHPILPYIRGKTYIFGKKITGWASTECELLAIWQLYCLGKLNIPIEETTLIIVHHRPYMRQKVGRKREWNYSQEEIDRAVSKWKEIILSHQFPFLTRELVLNQ